MKNLPFIDKLCKSNPSLPPDQSWKLFKSLITGEKDDWIIASSAIIPLEQVASIADAFSLCYAQVNSSTQSYVTPYPAHIFVGQNPDETIKFHGVLYSNGAIVYTENLIDPEQFPPLLICWLEPQVADVLRIAYVDPIQQVVHNTTCEEAFEIFHEII